MIQGADYLAVVDILDRHPSDAAMRMQISRLYYAAFLESRSWCELHLGYSRVKMAREHQAIANALSVVDPELHVSLRALRETRNAADYDDHLTPAQVADLLTFARSLAAETLTKLKTLQA